MSGRTHSEENYLKTIYNLGRHGEIKVSLKLLSGALRVNPASAIEMLKKLTESGFLEYERLTGVLLTDKGKKVALLVVRKHRLWEVFLKEKLNYSWAEVHEIAEQMEHISYPGLADRLDEFLGHPAYDPHGDPIPNALGELPEFNGSNLNDIPVGSLCRLVAVTETSDEFFSYLRQLKIEIGTNIRILDKHAYDGTIEITLPNNSRAAISKKFASNLWVFPQG